MRRVRRFPLIAQVVAGVVALAWLAVMADAQPDIQDVTLRLSGQSCEANVVNVESALLRLRGVMMVDIEAKKATWSWASIPRRFPSLRFSRPWPTRRAKTGSVPPSSRAVSVLDIAKPSRPAAFAIAR